MKSAGLKFILKSVLVLRFPSSSLPTRPHPCISIEFQPLATKSSRPIVTWHTYDCDTNETTTTTTMMRRRKRGSSKYLSIRKRISLSSGRPSPPTKNTYVHTCTRVHAPTLAYGTNTMRGNDGSRSPRVTEYSSMFSLGDSLAWYCAIFARQRTASARAFFPIFHPPFLPPRPPRALLFHRFPLPFVHRFETETAPRSSRLIKLRGRGRGGPLRSLPVSRAREIDSRGLPAASRVPVPRATRYSGRSNFSAPRSCASPYLDLSQRNRWLSSTRPNRALPPFKI